ncbi:MAG: recombination-associated protein RdgC [Burkholderiaceae bacterium]|nr:recombination-associated protein RdgC [Burkholderiaceae bacterium]
MTIFRNLQIYRLSAPWSICSQSLAASLQAQRVQPILSTEMVRHGWDEPFPGRGLVYELNRQLMIMLVTEKRLLPPTVVNQVVKARAAEIEEQQGFAPGKRAMKELKEKVRDELLPKAFAVRSQVMAWIDTLRGWLVIDSPTAARADEVVKYLLKADDRFPLESLRVQRSVGGTMTEWLESDEAPASFTVDMDTELRAAGEGRAAVRYVRHTLPAEEVRHHISGGKHCTKLALTWDGKISFVLTDALCVKQVKFLDVMKDAGGTARNENDRADSEFALMTGELDRMMGDLVAALGGIALERQAAA